MKQLRSKRIRSNMNHQPGHGGPQGSGGPSGANYYGGGPQGRYGPQGAGPQGYGAPPSYGGNVGGMGPGGMRPPNPMQQQFGMGVQPQPFSGMMGTGSQCSAAAADANPAVAATAVAG